MRPKFNERLRMTPDGTWVKAEGPIGMNGTEEEAYISVWITQRGGATGMGIGEKEKEELTAAFEAGAARLEASVQTAVQAAQQGTSGVSWMSAAADAAPLWDLPVEARHGTFTAGEADAEAWIYIDEGTDNWSRVMWTDKVELFEDPDLPAELAAHASE